MIAKATVVMVSLVLAGATRMATADVLNMPGSQKSVQFVPVGDAGNQPDKRYVSSGVGAVGYTYQIGMYDVTAGQYCQFLNAVATVADPYGLYNPRMADPVVNLGDGIGSTGCGIVQSGTGSGYSYSVAAGKEDFPVNYVSWGDAVRFVNWLGNGQGSGDTESGSYSLNGATSNADLMAVTRNAGARYVLPTEDEWYKAAYYKAGSTSAGYWEFPTRSSDVPSNVLSGTGTNNANFLAWNPYLKQDVFTDPTNLLTPVGAFAASPGPYGTFDQGGNLSQWQETGYSGVGRTTKGGSFASVATGLQAAASGGGHPLEESSYLGFRVALVPEPLSVLLVALGGGSLLVRRRSGRA